MVIGSCGGGTRGFDGGFSFFLRRRFFGEPRLATSLDNASGEDGRESASETESKPSDESKLLTDGVAGGLGRPAALAAARRISLNSASAFAFSSLSRSSLDASSRCLL